MTPFKVTQPTGKRVPILLSVPHCGIEFPRDLRSQYKGDLLKDLDDADWFVEQLYNFAPALGITMINSVYHRWVIDLNRAPDDKPLYTDGRIITGLCPVTDFKGTALYADERTSLSQQEIDERVTKYYLPYHDKLTALISEIKSECGKVLIWECHSIRQYVPTIYKDKLPDLILGDSDGASASPETVKVAYDHLGSSAYALSHNYPFKGGYITRQYGKPLRQEEAMQLEMTKINYMDDREIKYDDDRAGKMRTVLSKTLTALARHLLERN
jgi:N-formylglutamate deformylase